MGLTAGSALPLHLPRGSPTSWASGGSWKGQVPKVGRGSPESRWTPQPAEDSRLRCPWSAPPQLRQKGSGMGAGVSEGEGQSEHSPDGWGIYGFSNYLTLRPKCGFTGLKGEELALCRKVGRNPSNHLQGSEFSGGNGCPLAKLKRKRPHCFEIMSIIA